MTETKKGLPVIYFASAAAWEAWLAQNHAAVDGLWLKMAKKASGIPSVTYEDAVEGALCYGWIDSQKLGYDEDYWLQRFTPRRPRSKWSQRNRERATGLIADGRMEPAGMTQVELAQQDGRWDAAYAGQSQMQVPADLQARLDENPKAKEFFATLNNANRFAILVRIDDAKRPETRARRIEKFIAMLNDGKKLY